MHKFISLMLNILCHLYQHLSNDICIIIAYILLLRRLTTPVTADLEVVHLVQRYQELSRFLVEFNGSVFQTTVHSKNKATLKPESNSPNTFLHYAPPNLFNDTANKVYEFSNWSRR